jgi:hypothetical protein
MSFFFSWQNADAAMSRTVVLAKIVLMVRMPRLRQGLTATHEPLQTHEASRRNVGGMEHHAARVMRDSDLQSSIDAHILRSR